MDGVVAELRGEHRRVIPILSWGAHRLPMRPDADQSLRGHARILSEFLELLDLCDVTLVEVDSGMAQVLAGERSERLARLVLCPCEAVDNYPPAFPAACSRAGRSCRAGCTIAQPQRVRAL